MKTTEFHPKDLGQLEFYLEALGQDERRSNELVVNNAEGKVFSDIDSIKHNKVGLLLGTTPQARFDRITNYFFIYRIDAAEQL